MAPDKAQARERDFMKADFAVLGETPDFLAVDKPAGLLVHPTKPGGPPTLWDGLRDLLGYELATGGQVSLINRLDRETSGIVLVAKSAAAARRAGLAMQAGGIRKEYLALVFGWPEWDEKESREPILRLGEVAPSRVYLERAVHPQGAAARTGFRVEQRLRRADGESFSLIRCWPFTGRTHQIRVHLAYLGHPVIGDKLYARSSQWYLDFIDRDWTPEMAAALWHPRHALHCTKMGLEDMEWTSPLPDDLAALVW